MAASPQIIKKSARPLRHFDRSGAEWRNLTPQMTEKPAAPPVISTEAKRSGEISSSDGTGSIKVGDLSTQRIIGAIPICLPCRHAAPLEMTMLAGTIGRTCGVKVQRVQRVVVSPCGR